MQILRAGSFTHYCSTTRHCLEVGLVEAVAPQAAVVIDLPSGRLHGPVKQPGDFWLGLFRFQLRVDRDTVLVSELSVLLSHLALLEVG